MSSLGFHATLSFNRHFVLELASRINSGFGNRGLALELLIAYIMLTVPGLSLMSRVPGKGGEIDVLIRNTLNEGRPLRWFGDFFLIECKDRNERVSEKEFGHFLTKMTLCKTMQGAIVSRNGFTGSQSNIFAARDQMLAYSQLNMVILDIRLSELMSLQSTEDFLTLLQRKYENLRFGLRE